MSKAYLVLDKMPDDCYHCPLNQEDVICGGVLQKGYTWTISTSPDKRADYCPLQPTPERQLEWYNGPEGDYERGWNACIGMTFGEDDDDDD